MTFIFKTVLKIKPERKEDRQVYEPNLNSLEQEILQGNVWKKFFNNIENKTDLLKMVVTFFTLPEVRRRLETPLIANIKGTTLMITEHSVSTLFLCNHEEADSRLVLHATESDTESSCIKRHRCICSVGICLCEAGTKPPLVYED